MPFCLKLRATVVKNIVDFFSVPEVPCLSEVAYVDVVFHDDLSNHLEDLVSEEGRLFDRAPVQIVETVERPGAILVSWDEVAKHLSHYKIIFAYLLF